MIMMIMMMMIWCLQAEQAVEMLTRDLKSKQRDLDVSEGQSHAC